MKVIELYIMLKQYGLYDKFLDYIENRNNKKNIQQSVKKDTKK